MRLNSQQLQRHQQRIALASAIEKVPIELQPIQAHRYPSDNTHEFERWFFDNTPVDELIGKPRTYLPVFWTGFWTNNGYGRKTGAAKRIQHFVDCLPRNKTYWTICQYDDGCMVDFKDLDIKIFGMSGGRIDYPIPLLCQPHKYEFPGIKKDIFCSFVGADTHPIRRELVKEFEGRSDCYVALKKLSLEEYCKILATSVFALAPRGYGKSSFRIQEAIHYGAIPVYISDDFILPYNGDGVLGSIILTQAVAGLYDSLRKINTSEMAKSVQSTKPFFTYEHCKKMILENI